MSDANEKRLAKQRAYSARWRAANPEKAKAAALAWRKRNPEKTNEMVLNWRNANIVQALVIEARSRAKKRGIEFTITASDVPPMGPVCPLLGYPFPIDGKRGSPFAPSLDRKDPGRGYVPGNVWIVGRRANCIKNDGTALEHELIARAMRANLE